MSFDRIESNQAGDFPDRYLMTARKKGGASASQFVITMDDGEDTHDNTVGRLKATSRTSEEFQVKHRYGGEMEIRYRWLTDMVD